MLLHPGKKIDAAGREGVPLVEAAARQIEFNLKEVRGTLIEFRSPRYLKEILVAGYHLHFLV